jgi:outer membrane protein
MKTRLLFLLSPAMLLHAEVYTMSLREVVARAMSDSPDVVIARMDLVRSQAAIEMARDPFAPKIYGGSGAAWTYGYPAAINGNPPSIFQVRTDMNIFNRPLSYTLAQTRENARGAAVDVTRRQEDVVFRTVTLYLDAQQAAQASEVARKQIASLQAVADNVRVRVSEGRELEIQTRRAELNLAKARQRVEVLESDQEVSERTLAVVLGYTADDRVRARTEDRLPLSDLPESAEGAAEQAMANSKELRLLESRMQAKSLEIRGHRAARLPQIGLVAQYNLLARQNFQDFFPIENFRRNNTQLGAFLVLPLLLGPGPKAQAAQGEAELTKLQAEANQVRGRLALDTRRSYELMRRAETARNVARLDLDVAREQLSILLAQYEEGRTSLADIEQARFQESEKWIAFYDAQNVVERVRLEVLRQTGTLLAALQ